MVLFDAAKEGYELTGIDGKPVFLASIRLNRNTVPVGILCYDMQNSDALDRSMAEVEAVMVVNHQGTILCGDPFPIDEYGSYHPKDWGYLGKNTSLEEFQETGKEQLAAYPLPGAPQTESVM